MAAPASRNLNPDLLLTPIIACARASHAAICKDAMAYLLMSHLVCFYCGCRSAQKQDGKVRKWQCEKCQAVNHLDNVCLLSRLPKVDLAQLTRYYSAEWRNHRPSSCGVLIQYPIRPKRPAVHLSSLQTPGPDTLLSHLSQKPATSHPEPG